MITRFSLEHWHKTNHGMTRPQAERGAYEFLRSGDHRLDPHVWILPSISGTVTWYKGNGALTVDINHHSAKPRITFDTPKDWDAADREVSEKELKEYAINVLTKLFLYNALHSDPRLALAENALREAMLMREREVESGKCDYPDDTLYYRYFTQAGFVKFPILRFNRGLLNFSDVPVKTKTVPVHDLADFLSSKDNIKHHPLPRALAAQVQAWAESVVAVFDHPGLETVYSVTVSSMVEEKGLGPQVHVELVFDAPDEPYLRGKWSRSIVINQTSVDLNTMELHPVVKRALSGTQVSIPESEKKQVANEQSTTTALVDRREERAEG